LRAALGLICGALLLVCGAGYVAYTLLKLQPLQPEPHTELLTGLEPEATPTVWAEPGADESEEAAPGTLAQVDDGEWSRKNSEAIEALEAGELERALALFEECYTALPQEPVFAGNLAEALARLARRQWEEGELELEVPIGNLERAVELAPWREDLEELLARWRKTAETEEGFWTDETAHFLLSYDGERRDLLQRGYLQLEQMLESAYDELGIAFNHWPVGHGDPKIRVVLYLREEFQEVTGIGHWAGGVYDGVVRLPVTDLDRQRLQVERVLRHELVHAFIRSMGGKEVPAWLNEGLAQWHEGANVAERLDAVERARRRLKGFTLFPLEELRGTLAVWKDEQKIARGYAQSLAFVDYLARTYGEFLLYEMLEKRKGGTACADAFQARAGVALDGALEDLASEL